MEDWIPDNQVKSDSSDWIPDKNWVPDSVNTPESEITRVVKGVINYPKEVFRRTAVPLVENLSSQAVGGAAAVGGSAVAIRNYLTTLFETGNPDKALESATKGVKEVNTFANLYQPTTELGKESSRYSGEIVNALLSPVAEFVGEKGTKFLRQLNPSRARERISNIVGKDTSGEPKNTQAIPEAYLKAIKPALTTGVEFAEFGGLIKGGGKAKQILKDALKEKGVSTEQLVRDRAKLDEIQTIQDTIPIEEVKFDIPDTLHKTVLDEAKVAAEVGKNFAEFPTKQGAVANPTVEDLNKRGITTLTSEEVPSTYKVAVKDGEGNIYTGKLHADIIKENNLPWGSETGFIDQKGDWIKQGESPKVVEILSKETPFPGYREILPDEVLQPGADVKMDMSTQKNYVKVPETSKIDVLAEPQIKTYRVGDTGGIFFGNKITRKNRFEKELPTSGNNVEIIRSVEHEGTGSSAPVADAVDLGLIKVDKDLIDLANKFSPSDLTWDTDLIGLISLKRSGKEVVHFISKADPTAIVSVDLRNISEKSLLQELNKDLVEKTEGENFTTNNWKVVSEKDITKITEPIKEAVDHLNYSYELPKETPEVKAKPTSILKGEAGAVATGNKPGFYSKLEDTVNFKMSGKMEVEQLRKMLKNNGVSDAEIESTVGGLKGSVTKQQVLEEIATNKTKFEDVVLGQSAYEPSSFTHPGYVPGSYREMFVTAPEVGKSLSKEDLTLLDRLDKNDKTITPAEKDRLRVLVNGTVKEGGIYPKWKDGHSVYNDIDNPIIRIRFNDREVNGKKILFVEEMQGPSSGEQAKMPEWLQKRIYDIGTKRVLSYAKENGYDGVAWTSGEMQVSRYDLSKHLEEVRARVFPNEFGGEPGYKLGIKTKQGDIRSIQDIISAEELPQFVGKDLAQRIIEEAPKKPSGVEYKGLDLKVGGEGLKKLYDQQIPSLFKKYGKEEIGNIDITVPSDLGKRGIHFTSENTILDEILSSKQTQGNNADAVKHLLRVQLTREIDHAEFRQLDKEVKRLREAYSDVDNIKRIVTSFDVPYISITSKTPTSYTLYSDPFGIQAAGEVASQIYGKTKESVREGWKNVTEFSTTTKSLDEGVRRTIKGIKEGILDPERIMSKDPNAKKAFEELSIADENKNIFLQRHVTDFLVETKGIKKGSFASEQIGKALDGKIDPILLTKQEHKAYDFLKKEYDFLINEYARRAAGSEEAYQRVLKLVVDKEVKKSKLAELDEKSKLEYDALSSVAREIRGSRKVSELVSKEREQYESARQAMRDYLSKDIKKKLPEGEAEAYDILSRKISDYLPHLFEKSELLDMFKVEIDALNNKLRTATNRGVVTRYKNRLGLLEDAVTKLNGGELITFEQLPSDIIFRFFNKRKGKEGYSYDAIKAYEAYIYGITRKIFDEPALKKVGELYKDIDPGLKPYTKELVDHYMGYDRSSLDWLASGITSLEWMRTLGLNPRTALHNLTQRVNTVVYVGEKYSILAEKMMLFDRVNANKLFEKSGLAREVPQTLMEGTESSSLAKARSVVGFMFNRIELGNRKHAFIAGYLKEMAKSNNEGLAIRAGIKTTHKTQFRYGKLGMPKVFHNPFARVALQFSSYTLKQAQFLYDLAKENPSAFLKYFAYTTGINYIIQELFDTDLSNALGFGINFGEALSVIKSVADNDYRGAFRHLKQTVQSGGGLLPSGFGPAVSSGIKIAQKAREGKGTQQLGKELMPVIGSRIRQAYLGMKEEEGGEYPIMNDEGHPMYRLSARQLAQRTIGPKTERERQESAKYESAKNLELERKEVLDDITKAYLDGDIDKVEELVVKYEILPSNKAIMNELINRNFTKEEQAKVGKKEEYQLLREGELF